MVGGEYTPDRRTGAKGGSKSGSKGATKSGRAQRLIAYGVFGSDGGRGAARRVYRPAVAVT